MSWQAIGLLLFGALAVALTFLALAGYSRVEVVPGAIVPDKGVAQIVAQRSGIVNEVGVSEGQQVPAGALLIAVRAEEDQRGGVSAAERVQEAIALQDQNLAAQVDLARRAADAQQAQIAVQRSGISIEIDQLQSQIELQRSLVDSARRDYDRAREIAARGFISERDLQVREDAYLARQQQMLQLQQTLSGRRSALAEAMRAGNQLAAQAGSQMAMIAADRAQVAQQAASTRGARSYVLRAPVAGQVTALVAREGQAVAQGSTLLNIVPKGAKLRAELYIPSTAIGFVEPGQDVRLAIDAFPYQRFGTVPATVRTVSRSAVVRSGAGGNPVPVYIVVAELDRTSISAFGTSQSLVAGMSLTARIIAERQSLLEWLFEPLYAVRNR